jgi:hypothetical protein
MRARAVAAAFAVVCVTSRAHATDEAAGRVLFDEGRRLLEAGNVAEACPKFEEGMRVLPGIGMKYNLAECYERAGKLASAWAAFLDAASMARAQNFPDREKVCHRRAAALEPELARIVIVVSQEANVPGLVVRRDGAEVGHGQWTTGIPIDAGEHVILAEATGRRGWNHSVTATDGVALRVEIPVLPIDPDARVHAPPMPLITATPTTTSDRLTPAGRAMRVAGVTSMVGGAISLGLGIAFGVLAIDRYVKSNQGGHCIDAYCDATGTPYRNEAVTMGNVSTAGFVIGGVLIAAGFGLFLLAPTERAVLRATAQGLVVRF